MKRKWDSHSGVIARLSSRISGDSNQKVKSRSRSMIVTFTLPHQYPSLPHHRSQVKRLHRDRPDTSYTCYGNIYQIWNCTAFDLWVGTGHERRSALHNVLSCKAGRIRMQCKHATVYTYRRVNFGQLTYTGLYRAVTR